MGAPASLLTPGTRGFHNLSAHRCLGELVDSWLVFRFSVQHHWLSQTSGQSTFPSWISPLVLISMFFFFL